MADASRTPLRPTRLAPLALALAAGCSGRGCGRASTSSPAAPSATSAPRPAAPPLRVPRARGPVKPDGELDEDDWERAARTGAFVGHEGDASARPRSEARLLWDDRFLYVALWAADRDIRTSVTAHDGAVWIDDAFSLRFVPEGDPSTRWALDVSAAGVTTDVRETGDGGRDPGWESGAVLGVDRAGTPNDPGDEDEEWAVELAIPLASIGLRPEPGARLGVRIARCDAPSGGERACGAWGEGEAGRVVGVLELVATPK